MLARAKSAMKAVARVSDIFKVNASEGGDTSIIISDTSTDCSANESPNTKSVDVTRGNKEGLAASLQQRFWNVRARKPINDTAQEKAQDEMLNFQGEESFNSMPRKTCLNHLESVGKKKFPNQYAINNRSGGFSQVTDQNSNMEFHTCKNESLDSFNNFICMRGDIRKDKEDDSDDSNASFYSSSVERIDLCDFEPEVYVERELPPPKKSKTLPVKSNVESKTTRKENSSDCMSVCPTIHIDKTRAQCETVKSSDRKLTECSNEKRNCGEIEPKRDITFRLQLPVRGSKRKKMLIERGDIRKDKEDDSDDSNASFHSSTVERIDLCDFEPEVYVEQELPPPKKFKTLPVKSNFESKTTRKENSSDCMSVCPPLHIDKTQFQCETVKSSTDRKLTECSNEKRNCGEIEPKEDSTLKFPLPGPWWRRKNLLHVRGDIRKDKDDSGYSKPEVYMEQELPPPKKFKTLPIKSNFESKTTRKENSSDCMSECPPIHIDKTRAQCETVKSSTDRKLTECSNEKRNCGEVEPKRDVTFRLQLPVRGCKRKKIFLVKISQLVKLIRNKRHPLHKWANIITEDNIRNLSERDRRLLVKILTEFVDVKVTRSRKT